MTIPSRIQEILAEMERDPALATELRERILGQEFSQVPQAVAQNQNLITHMMERQIQLSEQFANAVEAQNQSLTRIENSVFRVPAGDPDRNFRVPAGDRVRPGKARRPTGPGLGRGPVRTLRVPSGNPNAL